MVPGLGLPKPVAPLALKELRLSMGPVGETCRMTDSMWALEQALLVPFSTEEWWNREEMSQCLSLSLYSQKTINTSENSFRLRQDMHTVFDEKAFAIVPKFDGPNTTTHDGTAATTTTTPSLVTHIFNPVPDAYFNMHYHNVKLLPVRCSIECLFARFAYTVFSPALAALFLKCETSRRVRVYDPSTGTFTTFTTPSGASQSIIHGRSVPQRQPGEEV